MTTAKPSPIPLENCPWCGTKFNANSFSLVPNANRRRDLRVACVESSLRLPRRQPAADRGGGRADLPATPCFLIATVDKFAGLPWTGPGRGCSGKVDGTTRTASTARAIRAGKPLGNLLPPPDLIIQDELHLISGPLGTMVGLYETAIDALCCAASTADGPAEGRRLDGDGRAPTSQIRALFAGPVSQCSRRPVRPTRLVLRRTVPDGRAGPRSTSASPPRGAASKVVLLRTYLAAAGGGAAASGEAGRPATRRIPPTRT